MNRSTHVTPDFPFNLQPVSGEAADGWYRAFSHKWQLTVNDMSAAWRIPHGTIPATQAELARNGLHTDFLVALDAHTLVDTNEVRGLAEPVRRYTLALGAKASKSINSGLSHISSTSRFCPLCLAETPRWKAVWRLGWLPACHDHGVLLAASCPDCGATQGKRRTLVGSAEPALWQCSAGIVAGRGRRQCDGDLRESPVASAPESVVRAAEIWSTPELAADRARDVLVIADHLQPGAFERYDSYLDLVADTARIADHLRRAVEIAADLTGPEFHRLATSDMRKRVAALPESWRNASPRLIRQVLHARDDQLGSVNQLRWMTGTYGRVPSTGVAQAEAMAERLPSSLWPDITAKLLPVGLSTARVFASAAIDALLIPGSTVDLKTLATLSPARGNGHVFETVRRCLGDIARRPDGNHVILALEDLAIQLVDNPPPIDYARRRALFRSEHVLSADVWAAIAEATSIQPGNGRRLRYAQAWVWSRITANNPRDFGRHESSTTKMATTWDRYMVFLRSFPRPTIDLLDEHAGDLLRQVGIFDEPLVWAPDVGSRNWPGIDLDDQETNRRVLEMIQGPSRLAEAASAAGWNIEHLSAALLTGRYGPAAAPQAEAREGLAVVAKDLLRSGTGARAVARHLGVSTHWARTLAAKEGLVRAPGRAKVVDVDAEWFRVRYLRDGLTLNKIADEAGCSQTTLRRIATEQGIPLRERGGNSHASAVVASGTSPSLAALARRGRGGESRVERFKIIVESGTLTEAGRRLGRTPGQLSEQLARLEKSCGGRLLIRKRGGGGRRGVSLTPLGAVLLAELDAERRATA